MVVEESKILLLMVFSNVLLITFVIVIGPQLLGSNFEPVL